VKPSGSSPTLLIPKTFVNLFYLYFINDAVELSVDQWTINWKVCGRNRSFSNLKYFRQRSQKFSIRTLVVDWWAEVWRRDFPNKKQKCYPQWRCQEDCRLQFSSCSLYRHRGKMCIGFQSRHGFSVWAADKKCFVASLIPSKHMLKCYHKILHCYLPSYVQLTIHKYSILFIWKGVVKHPKIKHCFNINYDCSYPLLQLHA
jgi:hypothetical protein